MGFQDGSCYCPVGSQIYHYMLSLKVTNLLQFWLKLIYIEVWFSIWEMQDFLQNSWEASGTILILSNNTEPFPFYLMFFSVNKPVSFRSATTKLLSFLPDHPPSISEHAWWPDKKLVDRCHMSDLFLIGLKYHPYNFS